MTADLIAERPQRYMWQAFLGKVREISPRAIERFMIDILRLDIIVVKIREERRKTRELWGSGGLANT